MKVHTIQGFTAIFNTHFLLYYNVHTKRHSLRYVISTAQKTLLHEIAKSLNGSFLYTRNILLLTASHSAVHRITFFHTRLPFGPKVLPLRCNLDRPLAIFSIMLDGFFVTGLSYSGGIIFIAIGSKSKGGLPLGY